MCIRDSNYSQFEFIASHLSDFVSASRFKLQKKKKVTCSHEDYQVRCQRVGDGKGRVVGNETMGGRRPVIEHPGNTNSHGKYD